ncbi:MAG: hypothetical protein GF418_05150 [Chitinivibrionales bacterium]|nr:hypothetical protein [Chitinivibrionales bacterium]MBD3394997.1 hypothetical protein [Chitinivibrionales bacterium]
MRSIAYALGGRPRNFDDCMDRARFEKPRHVSLRLSARRVHADLYMASYLMAHFLWEFETVDITHDETLAVCFSHETLARQRACIDRANLRLAERLSRLRKLKTSINIILPGFSYDMGLVSKEVRDV